LNDIIQDISNGGNEKREGEEKKHVCTLPLAYLVPTERANVRDWYMNYWDLDKKDKSSVVLQCIKEWGCLEELKVPTPALMAFIGAIQLQYLDNPYHNFLHALATVHYVFRLVEAANLTKSLSKRDRFALLICALCHDVGHQGRNSAYEVVTMSDMALRYNDRSPLENHHCAVTFEVALRGPKEPPICRKSLKRQSSSIMCASSTSLDAGTNIFKDLEQEAFSHVRKRIITGILGTDMSLHNDHVKKLQAMSGPTEVIEADAGEFLVELFMHTADVGNPFMPTEISDKWGEKIAAEFTAQVEDEERLGLPITNMMRGLRDPRKNSQSRLGFMDFVVVPLATPLFEFFPGLIEDAKKHLDENRETNKRRVAA